MKWFGTDGIRCPAAKTPELAFALGVALAKWRTVVVINDNRPTSAKTASALIAGLQHAGVRVLYGGVLPTPAASVATRYFVADGAVVVTASHNGADYNGLKVLDGDGNKIGMPEQQALDEQLGNNDVPYRECPMPPLDSIAKIYGNHLAPFAEGLSLHAVLDCANGAVYPIVKRALSGSGLQMQYIHHGEGSHINRDCGALHPQSLREAVLQNNADFGWAVDGDGDRCIAVTKAGRILTGDEMLYLLAVDRKAQGKLPHDVAVGTVLCNNALSTALARLGIRLQRTDVGDGHVAEAMRTGGYRLGAEPSGHVLVDDHPADGLLTGLLLARLATHTDLDEALADYIPLPQCQINLPFHGGDHSAASRAASMWQEYLADTGRIVLRPSGTEPVLRIMVEAKDAALAKTIATAIAQAQKGH